MSKKLAKLKKTRTVLMISHDSDGQIHIREWRFMGVEDLNEFGTAEWNDAFEQMLDHYEANGHPVSREYGIDDERLIRVLQIKGTWEVLL
jgi:hypothetical protein